jgi:NADPH-dependent curcumin reductase CurA
MLLPSTQGYCSSHATAELAGWLRDGRLISREHIVPGGVRAFPDALLKLFAGENIGKLVLAVQ